MAKMKVKCSNGNEFYMEDYERRRAQSAVGSSLAQRRGKKRTGRLIPQSSGQLAPPLTSTAVGREVPSRGV